MPRRGAIFKRRNRGKRFNDGGNCCSRQGTPNQAGHVQGPIQPGLPVAGGRQTQSMEWIVNDHDILAGQPSIRGTRLSVAFVLECLSQDMSPEEIAADYPGFPPESIPEVLHFAAERIPLPETVAS